MEASNTLTGLWMTKIIVVLTLPLLTFIALAYILPRHAQHKCRADHPSAVLDQHFHTVPMKRIVTVCFIC
jgi:hypothetical protein